MYEEGRGVSQSFAEAARWYKKAADQGSAAGQCNLGELYENGTGIAQDINQAKYWYKKSADQNHKRAIGKLASLESIANAGNNAEPLGFKVGVTPLSVVQQKDPSMKLTGTSSWTNGEIYESDGSVYNLEGLKNIVYIFSLSNRLDVVILKMNNNAFDKVNSYLRSKYSVVSQDIPYVGDKSVQYTQGNSIIILEAPHLSFEMSLFYKTTAFDTAHKQKKAENERIKTIEEKSKF